jgi:hypothetical protein
MNFKSNPKHLTDSYTDKRAAGKTIGSTTDNGIIRQGRDEENIIAIDNGALRFQPLIKHGWGRQGIAYGPYERTNGLAFATLILNGHNTSQAEPIESFLARIKTWIRGNRVEFFPIRLLRWLFWKHNRKFGRRLWWWISLSSQANKFFPIKLLDENLSVGWFPNEVPANPLEEGNSFIVHATGGANGELWARIGDNILAAFKNLQNLQIYYIIILRETGAAYYAAATPNAYGLTAYPKMRPIALDPFNNDREVYAAIYQSTLGQIGFRIDTRVYGTQIETIPELTNWYGTAQAADSLMGEGSLENRVSEIGGNWIVERGNLQITAKGIVARENGSLAMLYADRPAGLIHTIIETDLKVTPCQIIWRKLDRDNFWSFSIGEDTCYLQICDRGIDRVIATSKETYLQPKTISSLQILDEGKEFSIYLNGKLVFEDKFKDTRLVDATGVGIGFTVTNNNQFIRYLEAHPRSISIPTQLDLGAPWCKEGTEILVKDDFSGASNDLAGRVATFGDRVWRKDLGKGKFVLTGDGKVCVVDAKTKPHPGRTFYTVDWGNPDFADVQVDITPPGNANNTDETSRGGLVFWQDPQNYLLINNWMSGKYDGASLSCFFHLDGGDELYDAAWTNVGDRISLGVNYTLRITFDGMNYTAFINNEPVIYRALTDIYANASRLNINRVGIAVNWEWGDDTGSMFANFVAKAQL